MRRKTSPGEVNLWPAFTDVLGSVLVVLVFMVTIFVINEVLIGREVATKSTAIEQLKGITDYLDSLLGEANAEKEALRAQVRRLEGEIGEQRRRIAALGSELAASREEGSRLTGDLESTRARATQLAADLAAGRATAEDLEQRLAVREQAYGELQTSHIQGQLQLVESRDETAALAARVERLAQEMERLNRALAAGERQLQARESALAAARSEVEQLQGAVAARDARLAEHATLIADQKGRIEEMDRLIKSRLVERVEELERYASDFFGRLREVFADNPDIKVVGDRFVFQSEVLFPSGFAQLSEAGKADLNQFVQVYRQVEAQIPKDLPVIIEVQGHTDRVPINTARFESNWELSSARALNVIDYLISQGVPPQRLAAVGMGEYHPIDESGTAEALKRNRRIELKITSR